MRVDLIIDDVSPSVSVVLTPTALKRARLDFNPSGNPQVTRLKMLAAALYSELERIGEAGRDASNPAAPTIGREAATAATHIQAGAMFAVSAATAS